MAEETPAVTPIEGAPPVEPTPGSVKPGEEGAAEKGSEPRTVPAAALADERKKRQGAEKELEGFRKVQQEREDAEAVARGDVAKAQKERDELAAEIKLWHEGAENRLAELTAEFSDEQKATLDAVGKDAPLSTRLAVADKLTSLSKPESGADFGAGGGKTKTEDGKIPPEVTTRGEYAVWTNQLSHTDEGRGKLRDAKWLAAVGEEARRKKLTG